MSDAEIAGPPNLQLAYGVGADGSKTVSIPDDRRAAAVAFLRSGGVKTPAEIETIVQRGHDELFEALVDLSEAQAAYKPSANDWCVLELMAHVVTTKRVIAGLCGSLGAGQRPPGVGPEFEEQAAQDGVTYARFETLAEARTAAQAAHDDVIAFVRSLDGPVNTDVTFRHFIFGALNSREWAIFERLHDGDHTPQVASIKASAGFPAT
jgi:hypothetical protein